MQPRTRRSLSVFTLKGGMNSFFFKIVGEGGILGMFEVCFFFVHKPFVCMQRLIYEVWDLVFSCEGMSSKVLF